MTQQIRRSLITLTCMIALASNNAGAHQLLDPAAREKAAAQHNKLQEQDTVATADGNPAKREKVLKELIAIDEKLLPEDHYDILNSKLDLASLYWETGKLKQAETLYRSILAADKRKQFRKMPKDMDSCSFLCPDGYDPQFRVTILAQLSEISRAQNRMAESKSFCLQARKIHGPGHDTYSLFEKIFDARLLCSNKRYMYLNALTDRAKDPKRELACCEATVKHAEKFGPTSHVLAESLSKLAAVQRNQGKYKESDQTYRRCLNILTKRRAKDYNIAYVSREYSRTLEHLGRHAEAKRLDDKGMAMFNANPSWAP